MVVSNQLLVLANLTLGNNTQYPMNRRLGGSQNQIDVFEDNKNLLPLLKKTFPPTSR